MPSFREDGLASAARARAPRPLFVAITAPVTTRWLPLSLSSSLEHTGVTVCQLGVLGFCAASHTSECGTNGLPLTLNSIRILGEAQALKGIQHRNLCELVEVLRGDQERLYLISEHYETNASHLMLAGEPTSSQISAIAHDVFEGLRYLHDRHIVSRNVSLENVLITKSGRAVLSNYGLYYASESGRSVVFPIGDVLYFPPELVVRGPYSEVSSTPKEDVWAVGVVLIQLALRAPLWPHLRPTEGPGDPFLILERILEYHGGEVLNSEQRMVGGFAMRRLRTFATGPCDNLAVISVDTAAIIAACLNPTAKCRPTAAQILSHPGFAPCIPTEALEASWRGTKSGKLPSALAGLDLGEASVAEKHGLRLAARRAGASSVESASKALSMSIADNPLEAWVLKDVYYLWSLLDISLQDEFIRKGYLSQLPAIVRLPKMSRPGEKDIADNADNSMIYAPKVYLLDTDALSKRLSEADLDLFPRVVPIEGLDDDPVAIENGFRVTQELPLLIRERDLDYQHSRLTLFRRLLRGYPFTRDRVLREAIVDIPGVVRSQVWSVILEVPHDIDEAYKRIDKESPGPTDHQLAVDIPRCHQYDPLLSSPAGHAKFRRVLKTWILSNPDLVYWQGLDSVCAPFLVNSFQNESIVFGCLHSFVRRYLGHFFLKDNSQTMQECLAIFVHMICYHDPELGYHMHSIGFIPDLFAIPWFLTCFAHVFPLDKIMHIWDSLILSGPTMIILIGVAILKSIRDVLLSFNFEQCILMFSDAPDVDVESIIVDARALFNMTRPSLCARQYSGIPSELKDGNYQVPDIITLKTQICPCISIHDFMELTVLGDGADGSGPRQHEGIEEADKKGSGAALAIDIRSLSEYLTGTLETDHVNVPFDEAFRENSEDIKVEHLEAIRPWKGKPLIIIEKRPKNAARFAEALIKEKFPKVSILNGGASVLRVQGLLHTTVSGLRGASRGSGDMVSPEDREMQLEFGESFDGGGYYDNI